MLNVMRREKRLVRVLMRKGKESGGNKSDLDPMADLSQIWRNFVADRPLGV